MGSLKYEHTIPSVIDATRCVKVNLTIVNALIQQLINDNEVVSHRGGANLSEVFLEYLHTQNLQIVANFITIDISDNNTLLRA